MNIKSKCQFIIIALMVVVFSSCKQGGKSEVVSSGQLKIAYVNSDTVTQYYHYSDKILNDLTQKQTALQGEFQKLVDNYKTQRQKFEKATPIMGKSELQRRASEITAMEQNLKQKEMALQTQLSQAEKTQMAQYVKQTNEYVQKIGAKMGYDFIFSYRNRGEMLYGNKKYDITKKMIEALNEAYDKQSK